MMITPENIQGLSFFEGITDEQAEKIAQIASLSEHEMDEVIQQEGDDCEEFYFVHSGLVALEIAMHQDNRVTIDTIKPGEMFGWSAFVPPHKVTASSICKEDVTLIQISRNAFLDVMNRDIQLKANIMEKILLIVANRLKDTREQLNYLLAWN